MKSKISQDENTWREKERGESVLQKKIIIISMHGREMNSDSERKRGRENNSEILIKYLQNPIIIIVMVIGITFMYAAAMQIDQIKFLFLPYKV